MVWGDFTRDASCLKYSTSAGIFLDGHNYARCLSLHIYHRNVLCGGGYLHVDFERLNSNLCSRSLEGRNAIGYQKDDYPPANLSSASSVKFPQK